MATSKIYERPIVGDKRQLCSCGYIRGTCPACNRVHERRMDRQADRRRRQNRAD